MNEEERENVRWMACSFSHVGSSVPVPAFEINIHIQMKKCYQQLQCSSIVAFVYNLPDLEVFCSLSTVNLFFTQRQRLTSNLYTLIQIGIW